MFKISFLLLSIIFPNPFLDLSLELIVDDFEKPIYAVFSPLDQNGNSTMLVLEQGGMIYMISNNSKKIFLDWEQYTQTPLYPGDERGLFCLAFDPNYNINRKIYIYYMDKDDVSIISQFEVTPDFLSVDEESEIEILRIEQPYSNHNGGQIAFDNEGYFYIGLGDGGSAGDPFNN